jgi:arsenate reductase
VTTPPLGRRLLAEWLGSGLLATVVIGSGIAAASLSPGNVGLELAINAGATAAGLYALILVFAPVSGAHFNPVVSMVDAALGGVRWVDAVWYAPAQVVGCVSGAVLANVMFGRAVVSISVHHRSNGAHLVSEVVATAGLLLVIFALVRSERAQAVPAAVGAYIGAAYWFTSSTSFANPAITVGRIFSNSFAGIAPTSVPGFVLAQLCGGALGWAVIRLLYPSPVGPAASPVSPTTAAGAPGPSLVSGPDAASTTNALSPEMS